MRQIEVVAAVIRDDAGCLFSTQRGYGPWQGYWEFPGGKIEPGEKPEDALQREIQEELATEVDVGQRLRTIEWDYPQFHLTMHCYLCHIRSGSLTLKEHSAARWLRPDELETVRWLPADVQLLPLLRSAATFQPV